jgi:uncharacterized SAM-binding protein YcdF (DUF218 family)
MSALAVICAACGFTVLAVPGLRFSALLLLCLAAFCAALAVLGRLGKRRARRVLLALFGAGFVCFAVLEALVVSGADGDGGGERVSCVVVLGAGVNGTEPSLMLCTRLDAALAYLAGQGDIPVIVSGCQGNGEDISEAECMYRYLTARGVAPERVWKEERATSTRTNFTCSRALMAARGIEPTAPFAYVTNDYHVYRAGVVAGVPQARGVAAKLPRSLYFDALEVNYFIREAFALANELLFRMDLDL